MMKFRHDAEVLFVSAALEYLADAFFQTVRKIFYLLILVNHKNLRNKKRAVMSIMMTWQLRI